VTIEELRRFHQAKPFEPFLLHVADGRELPVRHPEFLGFAGGRTAFVGQPDGSFDVVDLLLVTSIEVRNGRREKKRRR